jgi:predicted enzyme related to lactoylglutathione lyase
MHQTSGQEPRGPVNGVRPGDVSYLTLQVVDGARAREFYAAVFGWEFTPGHSPDGWEPADVVPMTGMHGGHAWATAIAMYRVDDITAAVARVRANGGTAIDPQTQPYGQMSECTDDQGTHFYLGQH